MIPTLNKYKQLALLPAIALTMASTAAFALNVGDTMGTTEEAVRTALEAKGASIEEIEVEDGMIEAEFVLDGKEMEIEIDMASGEIVEIEFDDDDDDEAEEKATKG